MWRRGGGRMGLSRREGIDYWRTESERRWGVMGWNRRGCCCKMVAQGLEDLCGQLDSLDVQRDERNNVRGRFHFDRGRWKLP